MCGKDIALGERLGGGFEGGGGRSESVGDKGGCVVDGLFLGTGERVGRCIGFCERFGGKGGRGGIALIERGDGVPEGFGGAVAFVGVAVQGFLKDRVESVGEMEVGVGLGGRGHGFVFEPHLEDLDQGNLAAFLGRDQREFACKHLVKQDRHRVKVGVWADLLVGGLFRGDVKGRAKDAFG